jgi:hypothetical protein
MRQDEDTLPLGLEAIVEADAMTLTIDQPALESNSQ